MEALFIEPKQHEKLALLILPEDSTTWVKEIIGKLLHEFPELSSLSMQVLYHQKDVDKGYAVASVQANNGIVFPAVIHDFKLLPMDVMIHKGTVLPLTRETIFDVAQNPTAFANITKGKKDLSANVFDYPLHLPSDNSSSNFSYGGDGASHFIDKVSSFVEKSDLEKLLTEVSSPENYAGFVKNETTGVLDKLSSIKPNSLVKFAEATVSKLSTDRQFISTDFYGNSILKQANSNLDHVFETDITGIEHEFSNKFAVGSEVQKTSSLSNVNTYNTGDGILYLTDAGQYYMFDTDRTKIAAGIRQFEEEGKVPELGDYGVFVIDDKSTSPFEIVGVQKVAGAGNFEVIGWDGLNKTAYYPLRGIDSEDFLQHDEYDNSYYVPGNAKFVKLAGQLHVSFDSIDNDLKRNYIERDEIGLYSYNGPGFSKYSESNKHRDLTNSEVKWAAIHCGALESDVSKIDSLVKNSHMILKGKIESPKTKADIEKVITAEYDKITAPVKTISSSLAKYAATLADKDSVDAMLSLGLLNKRNVMEYIELLPEYEQILSQMARLLLGARMGLPNVEDGDVKEAMEAFTKVVYALKGLQALITSK